MISGRSRKRLFGEHETFHKRSADVPRGPLHIQHVVEIGNVAYGQSQDLDLGQLLVRRQRGQQLPELRERHVEGLHADPLPRGVGRAVLGGGAPAPALLLPGEVVCATAGHLRHGDGPGETRQDGHLSPPHTELK
uniref:Uncharacterized protein n=1 Tax=Denticeps clupeoides TaxID=299321 RepID=A0AAY4EZ76_9TELE